MKLPPNVSTDIHIVGKKEDEEFQSISKNRTLIAALVKTNVIEMHESDPPLGFASTGVHNTLKIFIPLPPELIKQEQSRLIKEKEKLELLIEKTRGQLSNEEFVKNAPPQLVEKQKKALEQAEQELREILLKI